MRIHITITQLCIVVLCTTFSTLHSQTTMECNACIGNSTYSSLNCNYEWVQLPHEPDRNSAPFEVIFEDNFNGTSLDVAKWWGYLGNTSANYPHNFVCYQMDNIIMDGSGIARFRTLQETVTNCQDIESWSNTNTYTRNYTTPNIWSLQEFGPGKFEIRCRIPNVQAQWPAFWLYGATPGEYTQEIDVFEIRQDPLPENTCTTDCSPEFLTAASGGSRMIMTMHYNPTDSPGDDCAPNKCYIHSQALSNEWHTYTLIWDENVIEWFMDGVRVHSMERFFTERDPMGVPTGNYLKNKTFPRPSQKMTIMLGNTVYTDRIVTGKENNVFTCGEPSFPQEYLIDYVKVWKRNCTGTKEICYGVDNLYMGDPSGNFNDGFVSANIINTSATCSTWQVNPGEEHNFRASQEINLVNFEAKAGSEFTAKINPCDELEFRTVSTENDGLTGHGNSNFQSPASRSDLSLFPNPNNGMYNLSIQSRFSGSSTLQVIDMTGKILLSQTLNITEGTNLIPIDQSGLSSGIYFVHVEGFPETIKMIVTR